MKRAPIRVVVLIVVGAATAALGAFACGPGSDKPPLQPDPTSPLTDDASAPIAPPATTPPAN